MNNQSQIQNQAIAQTCNHLLPVSTQTYQAIESLPNFAELDQLEI